MFTKPKNGWTEIHIGNFEGLGSYIQDVPVMILEASILSLKKGELLKLHFDEEDSSFTLISDKKTMIITDGYYGFETYKEDISKFDLIKEICIDIEKYFLDWVEFSEKYACFEDDEEIQKRVFYEERKIILQKLLCELKKLLVQ